MGNSVGRAWQLSQLVEGVLTACNPNHGSLSCVKTNSVSFASAQARKLNRSVCFSFPHEVGYFVGTPTMARRCVSKQIGWHDAVCQGCPRCVSRSPEACFRVVTRAVRVSQPAVLSALLVIQLFGIVVPPPYFPQRAPKGALRPFSAAALFHYVLWCASEYSVVGRIYRRTSNCFCKDGIEFGYAVLKNTSPHNYALFMAARDLCDKTEAVTMADLAEPEIIDPEALRLIVNATLIARYGLAAFQIRARGAEYER